MGMPPWTQWTSQADSVFGSTLAKLHPDLATMEEKTSTSTEDVAMSLLAQQLIALKHNIPLITRENLNDENVRFSFVFLQWLHATHAPDDPQRHVQDEHGTWLTDAELRHALQGGSELHIPTRTVEYPSHFLGSSALISVVKPEEVSGPTE